MRHFLFVDSWVCVILKKSRAGDNKKDTSGLKLVHKLTHALSTHARTRTMAVAVGDRMGGVSVILAENFALGS